MDEIEVLRPDGLSDLQVALRRMTRESRLLAGGTDLVNEMRRAACRPDLIVDLSGVAELAMVRREAERIVIGATVTCVRLESDPIVTASAACLAQAASQVGSVQIRNMATVGGNVANASPCGDMITALLALDARVLTLDGEGRERSKSMDKILAGPHLTTLAAQEVITGFSIAPLDPAQTSAFAKIGSRSTMTVARLNAGAVVRADGGSGRISDARVVLGAVGTTAFRARGAEAALEGRRMDARTAEGFAQAFAAAVDSSIPGRYSLPYKRHAAHGLARDVWEGLLTGLPAAPAPI